jgi:Protein of unknown function (DUF3499)
MSKVCARPTCNNVATTRFSFDSNERLIILDRRLDEWGGSGVLCEPHADRLTVPRGWVLDDRRITAPRLFAVNKFEGTRLSPLARTARRLNHPEAHPSTPLPLDGGDNYALPDGYVDRFEEALTTPLPGLEGGRRSSGRHYDDGSADPTMRTPLLDRAFHATDSRSRPSSLDKLIPRATAM